MATTSDKEREILDRASRDYKEIEAYESDLRNPCIEDREFVYNAGTGQWAEEDRADRDKDDRPVLTVNKLYKACKVLANQVRDARPAIAVLPVDDYGDYEIAKLLEGIIRYIEHDSDADAVYADTVEDAIAGGFGYFRIRTYFPDDSVDQEIAIESIPNPFTVYKDPDGQYCFITSMMDKKKVMDMYPHVKGSVGGADWSSQSLGEKWEKWWKDDQVQVTEYYFFEPEEVVLFKTISPVDGRIGTFEAKSGKDANDMRQSLQTQGYQIVKERKFKKPVQYWVKLAPGQILEKKRRVMSRTIPVIEVVGDKVNVEGKTYKRSLIRDAKDPQRVFNIFWSATAELVSMQPNSPWIGSSATFQGHENEWDNATKSAKPRLTYNDEPPQRVQPPQLSSGHNNLMDRADQSINDSMGLYESFYGEPSNERSGRAIDFRRQQGQIGTFHFIDNLTRALVEAGRVLIDLIIGVYDTERAVRIIGPNTETGEYEQSAIRVNTVGRDEDTGLNKRVRDLSIGRYDVVVDTRAYSTRRQQVMDTIQHVMQHIPQMAHLFIRPLLEFMDVPGKNRIIQEVEQFNQSQQEALANGGPGANGRAGGADVPTEPGVGVGGDNILTT